MTACMGSNTTNLQPIGDSLVKIIWLKGHTLKASESGMQGPIEPCNLPQT